MIGIIFKTIRGQNPNLDVPGLKLLGTYGNIYLGKIEALEDMDLEKYQASVIDSLELLNYAGFLGINDDFTFSSSAADSESMQSEVKSLNDLEREKTLTLLKAVLKKKLEIRFSERFKATTMNVPLHERDTWNIQKAEAEKWRDDNNSELQFLPALAQARDMTLDQLAEKILEKAEQYTAAITKLLGDQHKLKDRIKTAPTLRDLRVLERDIEEI